MHALSDMPCAVVVLVVIVVVTFEWILSVYIAVSAEILVLFDMYLRTKLQTAFIGWNSAVLQEVVFRGGVRSGAFLVRRCLRLEVSSGGGRCCPVLPFHLVRVCVI